MTDGALAVVISVTYADVDVEKRRYATDKYINNNCSHGIILSDDLNIL
jgi:hypothetical protein